MRVGALFGLIFVANSACDKTPPEPVSAQAQNGMIPVGASADAKPSRSIGSGPRCWKALPSDPPSAAQPSPKGSQAACPQDPDRAPPIVPIGHVSFPDAPKAPRLETELMLTDPHRERGLMFRKKLPDDRGMLFAWPKPEIHTFWMHNTCIPLDMLFIDSEGYVAGIVENAPPMNDDPRSIDCPVTYVLEVNAGWSRRYGVAPKQRVTIEGLP